MSFLELKKVLQTCLFVGNSRETSEMWGTGAITVNYLIPLKPKSELFTFSVQRETGFVSESGTPSRFSLISHPVCQVHRQDLEGQDKVLF